MASNIERITKIAQSIYLAKNNRRNEVVGAELTNFLDETIDWVNQFLPELELEADWIFSRVNRYTLGTIRAAGTTTFTLPDEVRKLVVSPYRDLTISQDGAVIATFKVVNPDQIANPDNPEVADRATVIGRSVVFSRPFTAEEVGGVVTADVIKYLPELALNNVEVLDTVKPLQLVVLGVCKNSTLPDIVQGVISNSFAQKYADLLSKAILENNATAEAYDNQSENFGFIGGVW